MIDGTNKEHLETLLNEAEGRLTTIRVFMKEHLQALENVIDELRSEVTGPKQLELFNGLIIPQRGDMFIEGGTNGKA